MLSNEMTTALLCTALIALKENLGHASISTCEKYLILLRHYIDHAGLSLTYQDRLDGIHRGKQQVLAQ